MWDKLDVRYKVANSVFFKAKMSKNGFYTEGSPF
jgi:hypothetical protein